MRFETFEQKAERLGKWKPWFAWHPVRLEEGEIVWAETVMRRYVVEKVYAYVGSASFFIEARNVLRPEYKGK